MVVKIEFSRRSALKCLSLGAVGLTGALGSVVEAETLSDATRAAQDPSALSDFLTATLTWAYPNRVVEESVLPYRGVLLEIGLQKDLRAPIISTELPDNVNYYRLAVAPDTDYYWRLVPFEKTGKVEGQKTSGSFRSGTPVIIDTDDDAIRYRNPRIGAHWEIEVSKQNAFVPFAIGEPLSPWYSQKSYLGPQPPQFEDIKSRLPVPILENGEELLDLYWYSWKTFFNTWLFSPTAPNHQAVANLLGLKSWAIWGSTMVWDSAFMLHFARYANQAYPFITALDNCYARQHDNGFICRESDSQNLEVYSYFPLNPPLFSWAEWEHFQISNDAERLQRVMPPIVKHYEWYMKHQRHNDGAYWTVGFNEADDSPRNELMYYAVSATSYQALAARCLAKMAKQLGRSDLCDFFTREHAALGNLVRTRFWDSKHSLYNDLTKDGKFITELEPGVFCKHAHMFWPLIAEVADQQGVNGMTAELLNPKTFYRSSGIPSLSADSKGYREDGQYWKGSVWPPVQCMVQEGLRLNGKWSIARELSQKYLKALLEAYEKEKTVTENLAPDSPKGYGVKDFVGWGGIGSISNLFEYELGLQVNAPAKSVEWRIERTDRHGISNLGIAKYTAALICNRRTSPSAQCHIEVDSGGEFSLKVILNNKASIHPIKIGHNEIMVG